MRSFLDLVGFEYKKMFKRKSSVAALSFITSLVALSFFLPLIGNVYFEGEAIDTKTTAIAKDRAYARALAGRAVDETLLEETTEAYEMASWPMSTKSRFTPEYEQYARPYSEIFGLMGIVYDQSSKPVQRLTPEDLRNYYPIRHTMMSQKINAMTIGELSKEALIRLDSEIKTPFIFSYTGGYSSFFTYMYTSGVLAFLALAICLAPMFASEYSARTDQLILSSKLGKSKLISAKLFTAVSFGTLYCLCLTLLTYTFCIVFYGPDGAGAPLQLLIVLSAYPLTMLEAAAVFTVCVLSGAILTAVITLLLSSKFKSPFGVIILVGGLTFLPLLFSPPENSALLHNLYSLLPSSMTGVWSVFSHVPYELFGVPILPVVFIPVFTLLAAATMLLFARRAFRNHQIG